MIRTELKTVSLFSFGDAYNLTTNISMEDGKIGSMKVLDWDRQQRCRIYLGFGQHDSEYIDISLADSIIEKELRKVFAQSGFAHGQDKLLLPCPLGTFVNPLSSDLKCVNCSAGGFYSDTKAFVSHSCLKCPKSTFVPYSETPGKRARDCIACPQGTDTSTFAGFRACNCLSGFHRTHLFKGCKRCEEHGLECVDDFATLKKGYWWKWENQTHQESYEHFTTNLVNTMNSSLNNRSLIEFPYSSSIPTPYKCQREESCVGGLNSSCNNGYKGPLCEICTDGYYKQLKTCKKCPTKKWMIGQLSIMVAVIAIIILVLVWTSKRKSKKREGRSTVDILLGRLKIVIGFYQVTNGLLEAFTYIKWPDSLSLIGKYSEMLQLNVFQIAPLHCLFPELKVNAFMGLFAILAMNAAAVIVAFVVYGLRKLFLIRKTFTEEQKSKKLSQTKELIFRNLFFFLYVTYLSTCSKTASVLPLACHTLCSNKENKQNCKQYLKADYSIDCESSDYSQPVIVAYCAVVYIIFLPTASLIALWRARLAVTRQNVEDENDNSDTDQKRKEILTGLRFLFENYNSRSWYWELVDTVRKVILTSGLILVGGESRAYVGLACVMSGLYGMLFACVSPIVDPFENRLMLTSLAVTFVNLGIGAVSKIPTQEIYTSSSIDPYADTIVFKLLVFGANSLVIFLLVVQYVIYIYCFIKEWRKNRKWSLSCCLALLLPLNELQGEIRGLAGKNVLNQQLQTGKINMPSISTTLKDSGAVNFGLEEEEVDLGDGRKCENITEKTSDENEKQQTGRGTVFAGISIHEPPKETSETLF